MVAAAKLQHPGYSTRQLLQLVCHQGCLAVLCLPPGEATCNCKGTSPVLQLFMLLYMEFALSKFLVRLHCIEKTQWVNLLSISAVRSC